MKTIKLTVIAAVAAFITIGYLVPGAYADDIRAERHAAYLKDRLKLTDSQAQQVKGIVLDAQKKSELERGKNMGNRDAARKAAMDRRRATDDKIKAVLNDDQKKQFEKIKDDLREGGRQRGNKHGR